MATECSGPSRVRHVRRRLVTFAFMLGAVSAICVIFRLYPTFFFERAIDLWIVSDPVAAADAVAVFGGGLKTRPVAAAAYYGAGFVPKVLLSNVPPQPIVRDVVHDETEQNRQELIKNGVPAEAIELFGDGLRSTYAEAVALRAWALRNRAQTILVPTEYASSRRVRWILQNVFYDSGVRVLVPAWDDPQYPRSKWWTDQNAVRNLENEVIKYIYYRLIF